MHFMPCFDFLYIIIFLGIFIIYYYITSFTFSFLFIIKAPLFVDIIILTNLESLKPLVVFYIGSYS